MAEHKLATYRNKRNFDVTNEPKGKETRSGGTLKFSVQHHAARADHYDLRLELNGVALSWAIPKGPSYSPADKRLAVRVEDHPVDYMRFEGVIPKGEYGGGTVMLWDEGEWLPRLDPEKGLENGSLKFRLYGRRLKGDWALVKMKREEQGSEPWLLIKERDEFVKKTAGISRFTRGVRSGKSMAEIARSGKQNPFSHADVMLAEPCEALPAGKGWLYELKYDGHRTLAFTEGGKTTLKTRNGHDSTQTFSAAAQAISELIGGRAAVLDGEMIVAGKDGLPDFGALQSYAKKGGDGLCYVLFDLLALDGEDLRERPLLERKQKLKALLANAPKILSYSEHTQKMTAAQCEKIRATGMEGIVCKRADSPYTPGKNGDWRKLKFRNTQEFVIGGYVRSEIGGIRSLLVGTYEGEELKFAGGVGTGFSESDRRDLAERFRPFERQSSPFAALPKAYARNAVWLRPVFAAQTEFAQITAAGLLRQASFKGLRQDKSPREITAEKPVFVAKKRVRTAKNETDTLLQVAGVPITHPEKTMFPQIGLTKLDLARYYDLVRTRMFPYLKDRLLSLVCCPSGIEGEKFFRRHLEGTFRGIGYVAGEDGKADFYVKKENGVVSLAQYNAVEFHIRGSKKGSDRPDVMVFDLDPDEGLPLSDLRRGTKELRAVLDRMGLISFLKTSGGKGYHVVVPFRTGTDPQRFRDFAKGTAELLERLYPEDFTANISKRARKGKIFLDWQRNTKGATSAAPYSVRARSGAPVSMPIAWEELGRTAPDSVTVKNILGRLKKPDPWANFFEVKAAQTLRFGK